MTHTQTCAKIAAHPYKGKPHLPTIRPAFAHRDVENADRRNSLHDEDDQGDDDEDDDLDASGGSSGSVCSVCRGRATDTRLETSASVRHRCVPVLGPRVDAKGRELVEPPSALNVTALSVCCKPDLWDLGWVSPASGFVPATMRAACERREAVVTAAHGVVVF